MTWFAALAECALRTFVVACVAAAALALLRVTRASVRLHVWTVVLYAALAMPVVGAAVPALRIPVLMWTATDAAPVTMHATALTAADARGLAAVTARAVTNAVADIRVTARAHAPASSHGLVSVALGVYLAGVLVLLLRAAVGWMMTRRLERNVTLIGEPALLAHARRHAHASGLARAPLLAESDRLFVPIATSVLRPMIVLPHTWQEWDDSTRDAVLAHETAHIARRDTLTQRLSLVYRTAFWPSPFSWWLQRRLGVLAEQVSDEAVLHAGVDRAAYAETLLKFFAAYQQSRMARAAWHVAMARGTSANAEARVEHVLAWDGKGSATLTRSLVIGVALAMAPVMTLAATVRPLPLVAPALELPPVPAPSVTEVADLPAPAMVQPQEIVPVIDRTPPETPHLIQTELGPTLAAAQPPGAGTDTRIPPATDANRRVVVFLFDQNSLRADDIQKSLDAARRWIDEQMSANDVVTVILVGPTSQVLADFTTDREVIRSALDRVAAILSHPSGDANPGTAAWLADPAAQAAFALTNTAMGLRRMGDVCGSVGPIPQKKAFLYFSSGVGSMGSGDDALRTVVHTCKQTNLSIFLVNSVNLDTPR